MENKVLRRGLSGIYIFERFEGEEKRQPTCVEDCSEATQYAWFDTLETEALQSCLGHLYDTLIRIVGDAELCPFVDGPDANANAAEVFESRKERELANAGDDKDALIAAVMNAARKLRDVGDIFGIQAR